MTDKEKDNRVNALAMTFLEELQMRPHPFADQILRAYKAGYHQSEKDSLPEEPVSKVYTFKSIPRLLDMIQPNDRAKTYIAKLADSLDEQGYYTDANIVRESIKIMNGEKVAMATMDEEPVSEELEEAMNRAADETRLAKAKNGQPFFSEVDFNLGFSNGAQWQKKQDDELLTAAYMKDAEEAKAADDEGRKKQMRIFPLL